MDGTTWPLALLVGAFGLWVRYAVIKTAAYHGLVRFLQDAARTTDMREGYEVPRRLDRLAVHLAAITRRPPPGDPPSGERTGSA